MARSHTRPESRRDTETSPVSDVARRLALAFVALGLPVGVVLAFAGLAQDRHMMALAGGVVALVAAIVAFAARRHVAAAFTELRANPFKPGRSPRDR